MTHIVREVDRPGSKLNKKESLWHRRDVQMGLFENVVYFQIAIFNMRNMTINHNFFSTVFPDKPKSFKRFSL
jgi:hypothetical protein